MGEVGAVKGGGVFRVLRCVPVRSVGQCRSGFALGRL